MNGIVQACNRVDVYLHDAENLSTIVIKSPCNVPLQVHSLPRIY